MRTIMRRARGALVVVCLVFGCAEVADNVATLVHEDGPTRLVDAGTSPARPDVITPAPFDAGAVCPSPPADTVLPVHQAKSGTRLSVRSIVESGATMELPYEIFDTTLSARCRPSRMQDGKIRCLPDVDHITEAYADAAMTKPVIIASLAAPLPAGALVARETVSREGDPFECGSISVLAFGRVGAPIAGATQFFGAGAVATPIPAGSAIFEVATEAQNFVELQEVHTRFIGQLTAREFQGEDGSRLFATQLYDTKHDTPVVLMSGATRALPYSSGWAPLRGAAPADGQTTPEYCGASDFLLQTHECFTTKYATVIEDASTTVFSVAQQTRTVYSCPQPGDDGGATGVTPRTETVLAPCATIPNEEWVSFSSRDINMGGRLSTKANVLDGGKAMIAPSDQHVFHDATLNTDCRAHQAEDGELRCVPDSGGVVAFSDASCTNRIVLRLAGGAPPPYAIEGSAPTLSVQPSGTIKVFGVGAARPDNAPVHYLKRGVGCAQYSAAATGTFEVGASVVATTFAKLEVRTAAP